MKNRRTQVLLVEDEPADVAIAKLALRKASIDNHVHVVGTVDHALRFLRREAPFRDAPRPDVIFLDLGLPSRPGTDLLEILVADEDLKAIPVVVLSGHDDPDAIDEAYRLHARCFLTKPVDLTLFLDAMSTMDDFFGTLES